MYLIQLIFDEFGARIVVIYCAANPHQIFDEFGARIVVIYCAAVYEYGKTGNSAIDEVDLARSRKNQSSSSGRRMGIYPYPANHGPL